MFASYVLADLQGRINKSQLNDRLVNGRLCFPNTILTTAFASEVAVRCDHCFNLQPPITRSSVAPPSLQSSNAGSYDLISVNDFPVTEASLSDTARVSCGHLSAVGETVEFARGEGSAIWYDC